MLALIFHTALAHATFKWNSMTSSLWSMHNSLNIAMLVYICITKGSRYSAQSPSNCMFYWMCHWRKYFDVYIVRQKVWLAWCPYLLYQRKTIQIGFQSIRFTIFSFSCLTVTIPILFLMMSIRQRMLSLNPRFSRYVQYQSSVWRYS